MDDDGAAATLFERFSPAGASREDVDSALRDANGHAGRAAKKLRSRYAGSSYSPIAQSLASWLQPEPEPEAEAELGARLHHPNLVQLFGVVERDDIGMALVMELCEGDSLRQALDDTTQALSWELRTRWLLQIAEGMAELHSLL